jgi:DNA-binding winged helix-turn-helix (wHTH) protein/tetratricopeptide (TPR) repeat protein
VDPGKEVRFDGWTLNRQSGELARDGVRVRLQTHPQQVLEALLERPGELVTREQLIARLWPKGVVDFDTALNSTVRRLRTALGDYADTPRYIETLPRRGYRFIGVVDPPAAPVDALPSVPSEAPAEPQARTPRHRRKALLAVAATLTAAVVGLYAWQRSVAVDPQVPHAGVQSHALAVEAYERARFMLDRRNPDDVERAQQYFEEAVRQDSGYALAWAGLASARWILTVGGHTPRAQGLSRVRDAAERALELDPTLAEPHLRLANYRGAVGDAAAAQEHLRRATELEPRNPLVLSFAAGKAADQGRLDEAIALQRRAVEVKPLSSVLRYNLAAMLFSAGDLDQTEAEMRRLLELTPAMPGGRELLGLVLVQKGQYDDALALVADGPGDPARLQVRALAYYSSGHRAEADAALRALIAACPPHERFRVAEVYAWRGEVEQAFAWLEPASPGEVLERPWFQTRSPFLAPLQADPRWQAWIGAS